VSVAVKMIFGAKRLVRRVWVFAIAAITAAAVLFGKMTNESGEWPAELFIVGTPWLAALIVRSYQRAVAKTRESLSGRLDLEIGLLLLAAAEVAVQMTGGLESAYRPLTYVVIAFLVSFAVNWASFALVFAAIAISGAVYFGTEGQTGWAPFGINVGFLVAFALLNWFYTRVEIARVRENSRRERDREKEKIKEETRLFRLVAAPSRDGTTDEDRMQQSSVDEVHHHLYHYLDLLRGTLELHTAVLLFLDDDGKALSIAELVTDFEGTAEGPFRAGEGAVAAVAKRGQVINLQNLKPGYTGLCYYASPSPVRAFLGVPIVERDRVLGALCVDRLEDRPFTELEEGLLQRATVQVMRALENERVFVQLERSKREQTILHRASQALGAALDESAVVEAALTSVAQVVDHDFAALTYYDGDASQHMVRRAVGAQASRYQDLTFRDNTSLAAMAVKNRHYLPYRGEFDPKQQVVFTKRANLTGMQSLLILPLVVREDAIGTLVLAAERTHAFAASVRATLQVIANQLAVALANAESVHRLEQMATTDGLTGCLNKRAFFDEMRRKIRSADRFNRRVSLVVTDLDHFKSVNDTYGHATGDVVLKELGELLRRMKRETDVVARFGGEEFCILCEETDTDGAIQLAERIREAMAGTVFQTEHGELTVTCSLGVATYPDDAPNDQVLFEEADKALYAAKHQGRDRVCKANEAQAA